MALGPNTLGSKPVSATYQPCALGQVSASPLLGVCLLFEGGWRGEMCLRCRPEAWRGVWP